MSRLIRGPQHANVIIDDNVDVVQEIELVEDKTNAPAPGGLFGCCMQCFPDDHKKS